MVLANQSGFADATNRIITLSGADEILGATSIATLIYDSTNNRWKLVSHHP